MSVKFCNFERNIELECIIFKYVLFTYVSISVSHQCVDDRLADVCLNGDLSVGCKYYALSHQCMDDRLTDVCLIDDTACQWGVSIKPCLNSVWMASWLMYVLLMTLHVSVV